MFFFLSFLPFHLISFISSLLINLIHWSLFILFCLSSLSRLPHPSSQWSFNFPFSFLLLLFSSGSPWHYHTTYLLSPSSQRGDSMLNRLLKGLVSCRLRSLRSAQIVPFQSALHVVISYYFKSMSKQILHSSVLRPGAHVLLATAEGCRPSAPLWDGLHRRSKHIKNITTQHLLFILVYLFLFHLIWRVGIESYSRGVCSCCCSCR